MKTTEFNKTITSSQLQENLEKSFGSRVNLEKYGREQLEDIRNKLRTRIFQQEGAAGINDLLTNETYQKDKAMLALLNTRIKEMLGEDIKKLRDKMAELSEAKKGVKAPKYKIHAKGTAGKDYDGDGKVETPKDEVWGSRKKAAAKAGKPFEESAKPDFLDMDKDGDKKEPMKKAVDDKKVKEGFPTVADAKARHEKEKTTGKFDKKQTSTGTVYTKKHTKADAEHAPEKKVKEGFPTVAGAKADAEKKKTTGKFDVKKTSTGTQYTRKSNTFTDGGDDKDVKTAKKKAKAMSESNFKHNVRFVNESLQFLLQEDEEGKAKAITAAGDIVNDYTSWMQRVGQYQTKTMIELADAIKADFGAAEAEAFKQTIGPALSATLEVLTQQREAVSGAVATLAGEATPADAMGMDPGMDPGMDAGMDMPTEPGMDMAAPDEMNPDMGDEFGAADAAAGGPEASGRAMRESKFARKLAESHSIMSKLAK
jgi:hypothetical protein